MDLNLNLRSEILEYSLILENAINDLLLLNLGIFDGGKETRLFGNKASISFKNKIDLLYDINVLNKEENSDLELLMIFRNKYIKDIENKHFTKQGYETEGVLYAFLKPTSKTIRKKETTKHYLNKASAHYNESSYRDCLMECRRALENLSNDLWNRASKKYVFQVSYKVRAPLLPPDLMGIVNSLKKELTALKVSDFDASLNILTWFAGLETKNNQIWNYLNKGTHEESDRDDFDSTIVKEVLDNLIQLETGLRTNGK